MKTTLFRHAENFETLPPGQTIFEEGQPGDVMYVIKAGEVDLLIGEKVIETLDAGDIFGEMALIQSKDRSATARAKTECKLVPINEKQFTFMVQQSPHFALQVMQVMAERLRRMNQKEQEA